MASLRRCAASTVRILDLNASRFRTFATAAKPAAASGSRKAANVAAGALAGLLMTGTGTALCFWPFTSNATTVNGVDYQSVYNDIAKVLEDLDYDDGSYGPVFVRLAWHAAGTYSKHDGTGGSDGATMRFPKEAGWGANAGLAIARKRLEAIKAKYPGLSYADLWSLSGVVAVQEMGGPVIPWRPGRSDAKDESATPEWASAAAKAPGGRLPDASQGANHLRDIFHRMGFSDQEIVALSGAHALGRCHADRSGFVGPWTNAPTTFSNLYFKALLEEKWVPKTNANGSKQFVDAKTGGLMMLASDLALIQDPVFKPYVDKYAADQAAFFADFSVAFGRLLELGVKAFAKPDAAKPLSLAKAA